ncbi:hypothetical protein IT575_13085 [bacterium]|nr:hypothetical protein [bacterium]
MTNSNWRVPALLATSAALALTAACGANFSASGDARSASGGPLATLDQNGSIGTSGAEAVLKATGGSYALQLEGLSGAKAVYGQVRYDRASEHFTGSQSQGTDDSLFIAIDDPATGTVHFGWVLTNFEQKPGIDGSLELARLSFADGPAEALRRVSTPPQGPDDAFALRENDPTDDGIANLEWDDTLAGDGNNDGTVSVQDLTPIGLNFNQSTSDANKNSARDADYNKDGKVTVQDLANIGINFGASLGGYAILSGSSAGSLTELERRDRANEFTAPTSADGVLQWSWDGDEVTETTFYNVRPYDKTGALGDASTEVIQVDPALPGQTPVDVTEIVFEGSDTWLKQGNDFAVILTELSVDDTPGNAEAIDILAEALDLKAMVEIQEDPGNPIDGTTIVQWVLVEGGGLADVSNAVGTKGQATFHDRGRVVIEAHLLGDFTKSAQIAFRLFTIDSLALELAGGGAGPAAVNAGTDVDFTATGTFDWDGAVNGDELTRDLTQYVNWAVLPGGANTGNFSLNTTLGLLNTDNAASGDSAQVVCEYPGTAEVTLFDNQRRSSDPIDVSIN